MDLTQSVIVTDGQRLQVVLKTSEQLEESSVGPSFKATRPTKPAVPAYINQLNQILAYPSHSRSSETASTNLPHPLQPVPHHPYPPPTHLDEITNKVFNELLQEKVDLQTEHNGGNATANSVNNTTDRQVDGSGSMRSADWDTESGSSYFDRLRMNNAKKMEFLGRPMLEPPATVVEEGGVDGIKKPLIAKWKTGVKLQATHKSENHGE